MDVLRAQGQAYVRFALQTPELYRIATMSEGRPGSDVDVTLNSSAFMHMRASVQALMDEGIYVQGDATQIALEMWTAAHGVAALLIAKPYLPWGDVEAFTDRVLQAVCCGQIVSGIIGYDTCPQDAINAIMKLKGQTMSSSRIDNPFFARMWKVLSAHEPESCASSDGRTSRDCRAACWRWARAPAPTSCTTREPSKRWSRSSPSRG